MCIPELLSLFQQNHDDISSVTALAYNHYKASDKLPEFDGRPTVYCELSPLAEHKGKQSHEIIGHHWGQREVQLRPEVKVFVHAEVSTPRVIINGAQSVI